MCAPGGYRAVSAPTPLLNFRRVPSSIQALSPATRSPSDAATDRLLSPCKPVGPKPAGLIRPSHLVSPRYDSTSDGLSRKIPPGYCSDCVRDLSCMAVL